MQKDKTSILNPIQHIKLNQQLTTVTEEIEELKSRKEQLIFQAQCSTDKDMTNLSKKYDQMNNNLDIRSGAAEEAGIHQRRQEVLLYHRSDHEEIFASFNFST